MEVKKCLYSTENNYTYYLGDTEYYHGNEFPIGSVVYFVKHEGAARIPIILFGLVAENRTEEIYIEMLEPKIVGATINGVPIEDFKTPSRWMKLPKSWDCQAKLFDYQEGNWVGGDPKTLDCKNPDEILKAYKNGYLVKMKDVDHFYFDQEISNKDGYRIIRVPILEWDNATDNKPRIGPFKYHVPHFRLCHTYEEAQALIDAERADMKKMQEMTDEEWSYKQIEDTVRRFAKLYPAKATPSYVEDVLAYFRQMKNIDEVEVRISMSNLEWKRWQNKRWGAIPI